MKKPSSIPGRRTQTSAQWRCGRFDAKNISIKILLALSISTSIQVKAQNTELGSDCEIASTLTKLKYRLMSNKEKREFWTSQKLVIERRFENALKRHEYEEFSREIDDERARLDNIKLEAMMAEHGAPIKPSPFAERAKNATDSARLKLDTVRQKALQNKYDNFVRCNSIIEQRINNIK